MSKVLFLDIDGVLNSNFWNDSHRAEISDGTLIDTGKIKLLSQVKRHQVKPDPTVGLTPEDVKQAVKLLP